MKKSMKTNSNRKFHLGLQLSVELFFRFCKHLNHDLSAENRVEEIRNNQHLVELGERDTTMILESEMKKFHRFFRSVFHCQVETTTTRVCVKNVESVFFGCFNVFCYFRANALLMCVGFLHAFSTSP